MLHQCHCMLDFSSYSQRVIISKVIISTLIVISKQSMRLSVKLPQKISGISHSFFILFYFVVVVVVVFYFAVLIMVIQSYK